MSLKQNTFQEQLTEAKANRKIILDSLLKQQREAKATLNKIAEVREVDVAVAMAQLAAVQAAVEQAQANLDLRLVEQRTKKEITEYLEAWGDPQIFVYTALLVACFESLLREARCASCRNSPNKFMALDIISSLTC